MNKVPRWVFRYVGNKTFDFSSKKKDFLPKNDQIWPKIGIFRLVVVARGLYLARHLFTLLHLIVIMVMVTIKGIVTITIDYEMIVQRLVFNWASQQAAA